jgi:Holliday junction DNA helicase RuvA
MEGLGGAEAPAGISVKPEPALSEIEQDVLSALLNLGCQRAAAEAAVKKARSADPAAGFEPLFRRAINLVR